MTLQLIVSFFVLAVPGYFTPGPNNLMLLASVMRFGVRRTVPHALGIVLGFPFMVFLISVGFGAVFTAFPPLKTILSIAAALYFLWMAWHLLSFEIGDADSRARPLTTLEGALFQWINPKAWAMAVSYAAAFILPGDERFVSIVLLTLGCLIIAPTSCGFWMFFGGQLKNFLVKTNSEKYLGPILAGLMVTAVALFLL